ncbi:MAG: hypothetical protein SPL36_01635 [Succiniclasticum sp.]|nr:hypothetical protein [Succiniclasticum sp.]
MKQANRKYCVKAEEACKNLTKTETEVVTDLLAYESVFSKAVNDATKENKAVLLQMMRGLHMPWVQLVRLIWMLLKLYVWRMPLNAKIKSRIQSGIDALPVAVVIVMMLFGNLLRKGLEPSAGALGKKWGTHFL